MKVEVKTESKMDELPFPKLMKLKEDDNLIVLFTKQGCGICIHQDKNGYHKMFDYHERWVSKEFTDFKGSITITQ